MRKWIIKLVFFVLVFCAALVMISRVMNRGNENLTMEMAQASFPVVTMETAGIAYNQLHGYAEAMDTAYQRETVTELGENREVKFSVDPFAVSVKSIAVEVRSLDGSRLIQDTAVTDVTKSEQSGDLKCSVTLKDLMEKDREYMLVILLDTEKGILRYYTRIISSDSTRAAEKLEFVQYFHDILYRREEAREQGIARYLESNASGDNSSFHYADIHSSFTHITWGDLEVTQETEPQISIRELGSQNGSLVLSYCVSVKQEDKITYHRVEENYLVRFLVNAERPYLLDFDRTITQIPTMDEQMFEKDSIVLGITGEDIAVQESDDGDFLVFEQAARLCSYQVSTGKMTVLFSFYDSENRDSRALWDRHGMKVFHVEENGDTDFAVYGYMNRGRHEGQVGICVYHYDHNMNTVEEMMYIPSDKSYELLAEDLQKLMYFNGDKELYVFLDQKVILADTQDQSCREITVQEWDGSFMASRDHKVFVWQQGEDYAHGESLEVRNLENGTGCRIEAEEGTAVRLLGFIGTDVIYGLARQEDIIKELSGNIFFPMYKIGIRNCEGELLKESEQENIYVVDCEVEEGQITLDRVLKTAGGKFEKTIQDYIMTNAEAETSVNTVITENDAVLKKIVKVRMKKEADMEKLQTRKPKEVVYEGQRTAGTQQEAGIERYYAYDMHGLLGVYCELSNAVNAAYDEYGVVTDFRGEKIWERGNRTSRNQIMAIEGELTDENRGTLAVCLDSVLKKEGIIRNTALLLEEGQTAEQILSEALTDRDVLRLQNVPLDAVLYYLNRDIPVIAQQESGEAVLLTGFNEYNAVIMNPANGRLEKMGLKDAAAWFAENGSSFLTYTDRK